MNGCLDGLTEISLNQGVYLPALATVRLCYLHHLEQTDINTLAEEQDNQIIIIIITSLDQVSPQTIPLSQKTVKSVEATSHRTDN